MLRTLARHGRWCLVAGLVAGLTLPGLAEALRPHLPWMIALLLFLAAFRIGPEAVSRGIRSNLGVLKLVLVYQLAGPLVVIGIVYAAGLSGVTAAFAAILVFSAPSVTGSANFALIMKVRPEGALRLLLVGTALFPLTVTPILFLVPELDPRSVLTAAGRLVAVILIAGAVAFALRRGRLKDLSKTEEERVDGASALLLGVVVVGLMSTVGPMLQHSPLTFLGWLVFAIMLNFSAQALAWKTLQSRAPPDDRPAFSIVAGNRNVALFLVALPPEITTPLLSFIGCYQIPMYLTPILFRRLYRSA